jgi:hypothetical protein
VAIRAADQRLVAQRASRHALEPLPRQDHFDIGGDAVATVRSGTMGKTTEQPAFESRMRHDHRLRGERIGRSLCFQILCQRVGQPFGTAAAVDDQTACICIHGASLEYVGLI